MAKFMCQTRKYPIMMVVTFFMLLPLLRRGAPLLASSWSLVVSCFIRRRPFILIILNFIIIFLLLASSSFSLYINRILQKFQYAKPPQLGRRTSHVVPPTHGDHDTWWSGIVEKSATLDATWEEEEKHTQEKNDEVDKRGEDRLDATWKEEVAAEMEKHAQEQSFIETGTSTQTVMRTGIRTEMGNSTKFTSGFGCWNVVKQPNEDLSKMKNNCSKIPYIIMEKKNVEMDERGVEEEGEDTLDATWKAIMEANSKGQRVPLKKSDTWSSGDRGGGGGLKSAKGKVGRLQMELKKWQTFRVEGGGEERQNKGGDRGGWRRMEVVVTDHEELKNRADAFIARFTNDMRIQRLESDQRFLEMINRGH